MEMQTKLIAGAVKNDDCTDVDLVDLAFDIDATVGEFMTMVSKKLKRRRTSQANT